MPKIWNYEKGDRVEVVSSVGSESDGNVEAIIGKKGVIKRLLTTSQYDYAVRIDGDGSDTFFFERELSKLYIPKVGDKVKLKTNDKEGVVITVDDNYNQVELLVGKTHHVIGWNKVELIEDEMDMDEILVEVSFSEHLLNTFMSQYKNQDDTYTVPKEVLLNIISNVYEQE